MKVIIRHVDTVNDIVLVIQECWTVKFQLYTKVLVIYLGCLNVKTCASVNVICRCYRTICGRYVPVRVINKRSIRDEVAAIIVGTSRACEDAGHMSARTPCNTHATSVPLQDIYESVYLHWKRAGPITQRSVDLNHALLPFCNKNGWGI